MTKILEIDGVATLIGEEAINRFREKGDAVKKEKCVFCGKSDLSARVGEELIRNTFCLSPEKAATCPHLNLVVCKCRFLPEGHTFGQHMEKEKVAALTKTNQETTHV